MFAAQIDTFESEGVQVDCGKILCDQKVVYLQFMVQRSGKSGTDQNVELLIFEKLSNAFPANVFTDTCVNDVD